MCSCHFRSLSIIEFQDIRKTQFKLLNYFFLLIYNFEDCNVLIMVFKHNTACFIKIQTQPVRYKPFEEFCHIYSKKYFSESKLCKD